MQAAGITQHGELDSFTVFDAPEPEAGPGEVVIEIKAAALNHLDIWLRKGRPGMNIEFPHVLGCDAAGVVASVGNGVKRWTPGDEVLLNPGLSCGECAFCRRGEQSECANYSIISISRPGTFAEMVAVPAGNLYAKPPYLSWEEAAALPLAYQTAWRMLMTRGRCMPGEVVLIHGIGGGVALAALQLAKLTGAEVIVTSSSEEKLARAGDLGADYTVNYRTESDLMKAIMDKTHGYGVDLIIDAVGASTVPVNLQVARKGGRVVHCGVTTGADAQVNLGLLYWKQIEMLGSTMGSDDDFRQMLSAVTTAGMKPVIDRVDPLEHAQAAQGRMETGEQFGKIVLTP